MDDRARFERLYRAHAGAVLTFVKRRSPSVDADDVVAESFLAAWRRLEEVPDDPLPWLLGIARGVLSNRRRGAARHSALIDRLSRDQPTATDSREDDGTDRVLCALRQLSTADQELLLLVAWEQLSQRQIAQMLGTSRGAVAVRLYRARGRLERALATDAGTDLDTAVHSEEMAR